MENLRQEGIEDARLATRGAIGIFIDRTGVRAVMVRSLAGLVVLNPGGISEAIQFIVEHPAEPEKMGKNGPRGVEERFNWGMEEKKLLYLYQELLV